MLFLQILRRQFCLKQFECGQFECKRFEYRQIECKQFETKQFDAKRLIMENKHKKHKRVVRSGTEWFDADGIKTDDSDRISKTSRERDDDERILGELPPHWGMFNSRG